MTEYPDECRNGGEYERIVQRDLVNDIQQLKSRNAALEKERDELKAELKVRPCNGCVWINAEANKQLLAKLAAVKAVAEKLKESAAAMRSDTYKYEEVGIIANEWCAAYINAASMIEEALKEYGKHSWDCNWNVTKSAQINHTCTCGFDQALASAEKGYGK